MELQIKPIKAAPKIEWNYKELKAELMERVSFYETLVYTEDQIKDAKADRANLNKLKKALNDERIRLQKEYMAPFDEFKRQVDDLIATVEKPAAVIDTQVKKYEEQKKAEKDKEIRDYIVNFRLPFGIDPMTMIEPRWLNATVSMKTVKDEIMEKIRRMEKDAEALENLSEYKDQAIRAYMRTQNLGEALAEAQKAKQTEENIRKWREELEAKKAAEKQPEPLPKIEIPQATEAARQWVGFEANLTIEDARALKAFFESRGISFRRTR